MNKQEVKEVFQAYIEDLNKEEATYEIWYRITTEHADNPLLVGELLLVLREVHDEY